MKKFCFYCRLVILFLICFCIILSSVSCNRSSPPNSNPEPEETRSKYEDLPTVIIDAGHGGEDGGAVGIDGTYEKDINLMIAMELEEMLRSEGIKTRLTRSEDILLYDKNSDYKGHKKSQDMAARLKIAEEYENAVFISIHMNSFTQQKYRGLQVYYSVNSPLSATLADTVQDLVATNLQYDNTRKTKPSESGIYLLEKIQHPAVLIECGFLSNPQDCADLNSSAYRSRLCLVIFTAVCQFFDGLENNTPSDT